MKVFLLLLTCFLGSRLQAKDCSPCEATDLKKAFASCDLVVVAHALNTPKLPVKSEKKSSAETAENVYTQLKIGKTLFKSEKLKAVAQKLQVRANPIDCRQGLLLPPQVPFLLFLRQSPEGEIETLPCKGGELMLEQNKVRVSGKNYSPEALIAELKVSAKVLRERTQRQKLKKQMPGS